MSKPIANPLHLDFEGACNELFHLGDTADAEFGDRYYFSEQGRAWFWDTIKRLLHARKDKDKVVMQLKHELNDFDEDDFYRNRFNQWLTRPENLEKWPYNQGQGDDDDFRFWLGVCCEEKYHEFSQKRYPSHEKIRQLLRKANQDGLITKESVEELLKFQITVYDLFCLLDQDHDGVLQYYSLDSKGVVVQGDTTESIQVDGQQQDHLFIMELIQQTIPEENLEPAKEFLTSIRHHFRNFEHSSGLGVDLNLFTKMLWHATQNYNLDIDALQKKVYDRYTNGFFQGYRRNQLRKRLAGKHLENKSKQSPLLQVYGEGNYLFNKILILVLAWKIYWSGIEQSAENESGDHSVNNYSVSFVLIFLTVFGPHLILYSSRMNMLYNKNIYSQEKQKKLSRSKRFCLILQLTFIGATTTMLMDFIFTAQKLIESLLLPLNCFKYKSHPIGQFLSDGLQSKLEQALDLNQFEIESMKFQRKVTFLLFGDLIMILFDLLIAFDIIIIPKIGQDKRYMRLLKTQSFTTFMQIVMVLNKLYQESSALKEDLWEYVLISLKGKQTWVPLGRLIEQGTLGCDIDYGLIEYKGHGLLGTDHIGIYKYFDFKFSDSTLKILTNQIKKSKVDHKLVASDAENSQTINEEHLKRRHNFQKAKLSYQPRFSFGRSLEHLTIQEVLSFIDANQQNPEFVRNYFNLQGINWYNIIKNSVTNKNQYFEQNTDFGKPLLQVCIDNEESSYFYKRNKFAEKIKNHSNWQLREPMKLLLEENLCDPNLMDCSRKYNLLSYCAINGKQQAFEMIIGLCKSTLDPNSFNKDNTTVYGILWSQLKNAPMMRLLNNELGQQINYHLPQVEQTGVIRVPVVVFISSYKPKNKKAMLDHNSWTIRFPEKKYQIKNKEEVQQLHELSQNPKCKHVSLELLKEIKSQELQNVYKELLKKGTQIRKDDLIKSKFLNIFNRSQIKRQQSDILNQSMIKFDKKIRNLGLIRIMLTFFLETSSFIDFFSDLLIVVDLARTRHTAWFSFSLLTILAPYYTTYACLINYQIKIVQKQESFLKKFLSTCLTILPTMLGILVILDVFLMSISLIVFTILLPLSFMQISQKLLDKYLHMESSIIGKLFNLSHMEIEGFRSQRTIQQFQLESIPQLFFQVYLYYRVQMPDLRDEFQIDTFLQNLQISIISAFVHVIIEVIRLIIESKTSETRFLEYMIACYNSRENWIPRQIHLQQPSYQNQIVQIDHPASFCGNRLGYQIGFKFTEKSFERFLQLVANMSLQEPDLRIKLLIDGSFEDIPPNKIFELGILGFQKLNFEYTEESLNLMSQKILKNDKLLQQLQANKHDTLTQEEHLINKLCKTNQIQIMHMLLNIQAGIKIEGESIFSQLYQQKLYKMVKLIFENRKQLGIDDQIRQDINKMSIQVDFDLPESKVEMLPFLSLRSKLLFDVDYPISSLSQIHHLFKISGNQLQGLKNFESELRYLAIYAASPISETHTKAVKAAQEFYQYHGVVNQNTNWTLIEQQFKDWRESFPVEVKVWGSLESDCKMFGSQFLSKFAVIRRVFFKEFIKNNFDFKFMPGIIRLADLSPDYDISTDDLSQIDSILNGNLDHSNYSLEQLQKLDSIVEILGLDKNRYHYYATSRASLPQSQNYTFTQKFSIHVPSGKMLSNFAVPQNIGCLKSVKISSSEKCNQLDLFEILFLGCQPIRIDKCPIDQILDEDDQQILFQFDVTSADCIPATQKWPKPQGKNLYSIIQFIETLRDNLRAGFQIGHIDAKINGQAAQLDFMFEFFNRIENCQFLKGEFPNEATLLHRSHHHKQ